MSQSYATVVILSTLHRHHETVAGYSFDALTKIVEDLHPDVLVLELTQAEIERRAIQEYKSEYRGRKRKIPLYTKEWRPNARDR